MRDPESLGPSVLAKECRPSTSAQRRLLWLNLCRLARCWRDVWWSWLRQAGRVWTDVGLLIVSVCVCAHVLLAGGPVIDRGISASLSSSLCADRQLSPERQRSVRRLRPRPLCLDVSLLFYLTALPSSLCKWLEVVCPTSSNATTVK